jgi:hypothetical protein
MTIQVWVLDTRWISDLTGTSTDTVFHSRVPPVSDLKQNGHRREYFYPPTGDPSGTRISADNYFRSIP